MDNGYSLLWADGSQPMFFGESMGDEMSRRYGFSRAALLGPETEIRLYDRDGSIMGWVVHEDHA